MKILNLIFIYIVSLVFISCEKDNITIDKNLLHESVDKKENDLLQALGDAKEGWVMMVKGSASTDAYFPIVMKFDTSHNSVKMVSPFGVQKNPISTYLINKGTGGIILNFSSGSVISAAMRVGPQFSDLTDYQFNVLKSTLDTITLQCIRSGGTYGKEGGVVYKLFRTPSDWTWTNENLFLDFRNTADRVFINKWARINLKNHKTQDSLYFMVNLNPTFFNQTSWSTVDPFFSNSSARVFDPFFLMNMSFFEGQSATATSGASATYAPFQVHNGIGIYQFIGSNTTSINNPNFNTKYKFAYLLFNKVVKNGNNAIIDLIAYDKNGDELITGKYTQYP